MSEIMVVDNHDSNQEVGNLGMNIWYSDDVEAVVTKWRDCADIKDSIIKRQKRLELLVELNDSFKSCDLDVMRDVIEALSRQVHGAEYTYDHLKFNRPIQITDTIHVVCPKHGNFNVRLIDHLLAPINHQYAFGCKECYLEMRKGRGSALKKNTTRFIVEAESKYNTKYDYRLIEYINNINSVRIICLQCRNDNIVQYVFNTSPVTHLRSCVISGCIRCASRNNWCSSRRLKMSNRMKNRSIEALLSYQKSMRKINKLKMFNSCITRFKEHYTYDQDSFTGYDDNIDIVCNKCNTKFNVKYSTHMNGYNTGQCPSCYSLSKYELKSNTTNCRIQSELQSRGDMIFGIDKYDYSEAIFVNSITPMIIRCNNCISLGRSDVTFLKSTHNHFGQLKQECPQCFPKSYRLSRDQPIWLYYIVIYVDKTIHTTGKLYKIGITGRSCVDDRFRNNEDMCLGKDYNILFEKWFIDGGEAIDIENDIKHNHTRYLYSGKRVLRNTGNTEIFVKDIFDGDYRKYAW